MNPLSGGGIEDPMGAVDLEYISIEGRHMYETTLNCQIKRNLADPDNVGTIPNELGMRVVTDDEGDIRGDPAGQPVPFLVEGHCGSGLPAWLDVYLEHLLLSGISSIRLIDLP